MRFHLPSGRALAGAKAWTRAFAAAILAVLAATTPAAPEPEPLPADCMPVSEVRPGMIGEGRTVVRGYEITTFKAEILGVQHNHFAGGDLILAKLSGDFLEQHGVAAGMSGSPVYVDGKVIGAVAYGWLFAYQPYCGITPIDQMWSVYQSIGKLKDPKERRGGTRAGASNGAWDWKPAWESYRADLFGSGEVTLQQEIIRPTLPELSGLQGGLRPLASPLYLSGASGATEKMLKRFFATRGIELMGSGTLAGSAGAGQREPAPPLEGGSALGVPLLSGDLSLAGVGTVTYRKGENILGFGHPMAFQGTVEAPMAPAYMFGIMQAYDRSFKLGEVGESIGTIDQDRLYAVGGKIGQSPPRIPIRVRVGGEAASIARDYAFSCWENPDLMPAVTMAAIQEAFMTSTAQGGKLTADMDYAVTLEDGTRIAKRFRASSDGFAIMDPMTELAFDMFLLLRNPFAEGDLASIDVNVDVKPGMHMDLLLAARSGRDLYKPGEEVRLDLTLRPWRGDEYERSVAFKLPENLPSGVYVIHVTDADSTERVQSLMRPGIYSPRTFEEVVRLVKASDYPTQRLRVQLLEPSLDLALRDQNLPRLPASVSGLIQATADPRDQLPAVGREVLSRSLELPYPVRGTQTLMIRVADHIDE